MNKLYNVNKITSQVVTHIGARKTLQVPDGP